MGAIMVLFAALVRILAEYLRLRSSSGAAFPSPSGDLWVVGGLVTAVLLWLAVLLFFLERFRLVVATVAVAVVLLVVLKVWGVTAGLIG